MPNLICSVENCSYNKDHLCALNKIHVGGSNAMESHSTSCQSFVDQRDSFSSCESCGHATESTDIECEAQKCTHNKECRCHADGIDVCGCGSHTARGTECATFKPR